MLERAAARASAAAVDGSVDRMKRVDASMLVANLVLLVLAARARLSADGRARAAPIRPAAIQQRRAEATARTSWRRARAESQRKRRRSRAGSADRREQSRRDIADHNRELETLLYVISHDLREPLRAVEQFSQIVGERYGPRLDDKGRDFLTRTVRAAERMRTLLDDLLELSRARRLQPPDEGVDAGEIAREALDRLSARIEETARTYAWRAISRAFAQTARGRYMRSTTSSPTR
jgi:signal transduction histidine kinase